MVITNKIEIDLCRRGVEEVIDAVQGDENSREVAIYLKHNEVPWEIPEGTSVMIGYCRLPGRSGANYDTLEDGTLAYRYQGNELTIILAPQVLVVPGKVELSVAMINGDRSLHTFTIGIMVQKNPGLNIDAPDPELDAYQQLLKDYALLANRVTNLATLQDGSTTGDAELQDIRVGHDGTTYANAGEAVRQQVAGVAAALASVAGQSAYLWDHSDLPNFDTENKVLTIPYQSRIMSGAKVITDIGTLATAKVLDLSAAQHGYVTFNPVAVEWKVYPYTVTGITKNELIMFVYSNYGEIVSSQSAYAVNGKPFGIAVDQNTAGGTVQSVWVGKKFVAFGTSITWNCANYNGGYLDVIANRNGFTEYLNAGTSGRAMANNTKNGEGINDQIHDTDIADYDLVVIECCTNDFKLNVPLGSVGQIGDTDFDTDSFCGALRDGIEYILTADPTKHIMLIADPQRNNDGYDVNHTNTAGHKLVDYVNAMKSIAELYGLPVCDWYRHSGINALTLSLYTSDGLHPNAEGYKVLGNVAAAEISNMYSAFVYRFADVPSGGDTGGDTPPETNTWVEVATEYTSGSYIAADGAEGAFNNNATAANWIVSDFIAVSEGDLFRYAGVTQPIANANVAQSVCGYDANKSFVSIIIPNGSYADGQSFTIPAGVAHIRCGFYIKDTAYSLKKYNA